MSTQIGVEEFVEMMRGAILQIRDGEKRLTELDSACGDGDHGITMLRAMNNLEKFLTEANNLDLQTLTQKLGWTLLEC
jgi:hypothetical protein